MSTPTSVRAAPRVGGAPSPTRTSDGEPNRSIIFEPAANRMHTIKALLMRALAD